MSLTVDRQAAAQKTSRQLTKQLYHDLEAQLSRKRFEHILRVRMAASLLCRRYMPVLKKSAGPTKRLIDRWQPALSGPPADAQGRAIDDALQSWPLRFELAALLHDMTKEWPANRQQQYLEQCRTRKDGLPSPLQKDRRLFIDDSYYADSLACDKPVWHSRTAMLYAWQHYGLFERNLFEMTALHTSAEENLSPATALFFAADYAGSIWLYRKWGSGWERRLKKAVCRQPVRQLVLDKLEGNIDSFLKQSRPVPAQISRLVQNLHEAPRLPFDLF